MRTEHGATAVEYALLVAAIAAIAIIAVFALGRFARAGFTDQCKTVNQAPTTAQLAACH